MNNWFKSIQEAVIQDDLDKIESLLEERKNQDITYIVLNIKSTKAAQLFINAGFDPQNVDDLGFSILHHISNSELIEFFAEKGANINQRSLEGNFAPIHQLNSINATRSLVNLGVNINSITVDGDTVLDWAYYNEIEGSYIEFLESLGAKRATSLSKQEREMAYNELQEQV